MSTDAAVRLLGGDPKIRQESASPEELLGMVAESDELEDDSRSILV